MENNPGKSAGVEKLYIGGARLLELRGLGSNIAMSSDAVAEMRSHIIKSLDLAGVSVSSDEKIELWMSILDPLSNRGDSLYLHGLRGLISDLAKTEASGALVDYFISKGIDGAAAELDLRVGRASTYVFWGTERVASDEMLERRQKKRERFAKLIGSMAVPQHIDLEMVEEDAIESQERLTSDNLRLAYELPSDEAQGLLAGLESGEFSIDEEAIRDLFAKLSKRNIDPYDIVQSFAGSSTEMNRLMSAGVGVWEGYRLHEHTQAVLGRLEAFIDINGELDEQDDSMQTVAFLRLASLLQDIGKPIAVSVSDKSEQLDYNARIGESIASKLPISSELQSLLVDLISQDHIGQALKQEVAPDEAAAGIEELYAKHKQIVSKRNSMFQMLYMLNQADTSAYTSKASYRDADGNKHLCAPSFDGRIFRISKTTGRVKHTPRHQRTIMQIIESLNR